MSILDITATDYTNNLSEDDTLFVTYQGHLMQIKKSDLHDVTKLDKNQGEENANKILKINSEGELVPSDEVIVDSSLTIEGQAADSKKTGDMLNLKADIIDIPKKLPNIFKLIFTGAINDEYDGSVEKTINIPDKMDIDNASVTFSQASERNNIESGDTITTVFGKIKKIISDLKTVAFTGSYADLSGKPTIPPAVAVKGNAEASYRTGNVNITPDNIGAVASSKIVKSTNITQEGFLMDGKTASEAFNELNSNKQDKLIRGNNTYADIDKYLDGAYWFNADKITSGTVPFSSYGFIFSLRAETNTYFQIAIPYSNTADKPKYRTHANGLWQPWKDF